MELITRNQPFYQLVRTLRQPMEGEVRRLHIPQTMQATMREGGFPTLVFKPYMAETEYLFLLDRSQVKSQQVALFEYLFRVFTQENVCVERFFFHQKFELFTNETHRKGLTLRQLADSYRSRTLIIWSNGYPLLYPPYPVVEPNIREALAEWDVKAILTPVPFADWGSKERALQTDFLLLPADLPGQLRLMHALAENQTHQDTYLRQQSSDLYSTEDIDFQDVHELKSYLGQDLFQWLCALAIYPRIRWELIVEIGSVVISPEAVNFTNLLKLARISWMQDGSFPGSTRFELLTELHPENEAKARQRLLQMLQYAEQYFPGEHMYDGEKYILETVNKFALYAFDAQIYADYQPAQQAFRELYGQGLYPDGAMLRYLENPDGNWTTLLPAVSASVPGKVIKSAVSRPRSISLQDYLDNLSTDVEPVKPVDKRKRLLLAGIGVAALGFTGVIYLSTRPQYQVIDRNQEIPVTIVLDTTACLTAMNTNVATTTSQPRWGVFLNDSLYSIRNLKATRSFPLRNLVGNMVDSPTDSISMRAILAVSDTTAGAVRQYSTVPFSRDTLRVRISCPTPPGGPAAAASTPTVYVQYASRNQFDLAKQLQARLQANGFNVPGIELKTTFHDSTQVRYFSKTDRPRADSVAAIVRSLFNRQTVRVVNVAAKSKAPVEVWLTNGAAVQDTAKPRPFVCKPISVRWFNQFNGWLASDDKAIYHLVVDAGISLAVEVAGKIQSSTYLGGVRRICEQPDAYLIQTVKGQQAFLVRRDRAMLRTSSNIALVTVDVNLLNGPQGQVYFAKLVRSATFRRYDAPEQATPKEEYSAPVQQNPVPKEQTQSSPAQAVPPLGNTYDTAKDQTPAQAQTNTEALRITSRKPTGATVQEGINAYQRGQYEEAIKLYEQVLVKNSTDAYVLNLKGYSLFKLKRYDEAIGTLLAATKADPKYAWAYFDLARVYCAVNRRTDADAMIRRAIQIQSGMRTVIQNDKEFMSLCGTQASAK